jgi:hypothetical protein
MRQSMEVNKFREIHGYIIEMAMVSSFNIVREFCVGKKYSNMCTLMCSNLRIRGKVGAKCTSIVYVQ